MDIVWILCQGRLKCFVGFSNFSPTVDAVHQRVHPVLGVLDFLRRRFLDFWDLLPRSWQLFLARFAKLCESFQDRGEESKKKSWSSWQGNQEYHFGKRNKKVLHQCNIRSVDILEAIILENSKKVSSCVCFYLFFEFAPISIKFLQKLSFKTMVPAIAYEVFGRTMHLLVYMFRFAFGATNSVWTVGRMQETETKNEFQFYLTWKILDLWKQLLFSSLILNGMILDFSPRSWLFLDFLARLIAEILSKNPINPKSWQEMKKMQDLGQKFKTIQKSIRISKILARAPRRRALRINVIFLWEPRVYKLVSNSPWKQHILCKTCNKNFHFHNIQSKHCFTNTNSAHLLNFYLVSPSYFQDIWACYPQIFQIQKKASKDFRVNKYFLHWQLTDPSSCSNDEVNSILGKNKHLNSTKIFGHRLFPYRMWYIGQISLSCPLPEVKNWQTNSIIRQPMQNDYTYGNSRGTFRGHRWTTGEHWWKLSVKWSENLKIPFDSFGVYFTRANPPMNCFHMRHFHHCFYNFV